MSSKKLYKLTEVCTIVGIKSYVLRFWESEFEEVSSIQSSDGQKLYDIQMVEAIAYIKKLLFEKKYTIEKAKQIITSNGIRKVKGLDFDRIESNSEPVQVIKEVASEDKRVARARKNLSEMVSLIKTIKEGHNWK